ncbi:19247_t:CDS:2 [Gigaspora rosea]|nr:19247_t:CDS:2 [Gigaspora rosea]
MPGFSGNISARKLQTYTISGPHLVELLEALNNNWVLCDLLHEKILENDNESESELSYFNNEPKLLSFDIESNSELEKILENDNDFIKYFSDESEAEMEVLNNLIRKALKLLELKAQKGTLTNQELLEIFNCENIILYLAKNFLANMETNDELNRKTASLEVLSHKIDDFDEILDKEVARTNEAKAETNEAKAETNEAKAETNEAKAGTNEAKAETNEAKAENMRI